MFCLHWRGRGEAALPGRPGAVQHPRNVITPGRGPGTAWGRAIAARASEQLAPGAPAAGPAAPAGPPAPGLRGGGAPGGPLGPAPLPCPPAHSPAPLPPRRSPLQVLWKVVDDETGQTVTKVRRAARGAGPSNAGCPLAGPGRAPRPPRPSLPAVVGRPDHQPQLHADGPAGPAHLRAQVRHLLGRRCRPACTPCPLPGPPPAPRIQNGGDPRAPGPQVRRLAGDGLRRGHEPGLVCEPK